jgi:hypothetical protein
VTADANGVFALMANIPQTWEELLLGVTREGFERIEIYVRPSDVTAAILRVFPTITISPGEKFTTRTFLGATNCGNEGYYCRRIVIKASPGELIDVEVIPVEGGTVGISERSDPWSFPSQRQITVSGRTEVWIYAGSTTMTPFWHVFEQPVTVTARRH